MKDQEYEVKYQEHLAEFVSVCKTLVRQGQPYTAILLNHELFRFLYPIEPYCNFEHTAPAEHLLKHIHNLIALAKQNLQVVTGYTPSPQDGKDNTQLEIRTSDLYTSLWRKFDQDTLVEESRHLVEKRIPADIIAKHIKGRRVLDMGCGSGRYTLALAQLGAASVVGIDYQAKSYAAAAKVAADRNLPIEFVQGDVLALPFEDASFDFVFSNGVLHHTRSWHDGLKEYRRVMRSSGYLYLYASGGYFWSSRKAMREVFAEIPADYTHTVMAMIGVPSNRFIFMDSWYVPIEDHLRRAELEENLGNLGLRFEPIEIFAAFDPGAGIAKGLPGAKAVWGEAEHRYLVEVAG